MVGVNGGAMSILENVRATDRMMEVVEKLSWQMGVSGAVEFQSRIARDDQTADVVFLEMAELLWVGNRDVLRAFFRRYFQLMPKARQWQVAYALAGSFLDRPAGIKRDTFELDLIY